MNNINSIIGAKFYGIRRVVDMLGLDLGETIKDGEKPYAEFAFHVQTPWRFVRGNEILLASRDIYLPQDETLDNGDYDYEKQSPPREITSTLSIFDVAKHDFKKHFEGAVVKSVDVSPFGDLRIEFTNGVCFETFTPSARKCEEWRFLPPDGEQLIVFDR